MITVVLIFSLLLISVAAAYAVFRRRLFLYPKSENEKLPPAPPKATSLFAPTDEEVRAFEKEENEKLIAEKRETIRQDLIRRANDGDFTVLTAAKEFGDSAIYQNLLDLLIEKNKLEPEKIEKLASFVSANNLPVSVISAETFLAEWEKAPSANFLSKVFHISALANSAEIYLQAVKTAVSLYQAGKLKPISASELVAVLESHYWLLAQDARISGAGFLLKEELASARREITESSRG